MHITFIIVSRSFHLFLSNLHILKIRVFHSTLFVEIVLLNGFVLCRECTFFLVIDQFSCESKRILSELHSDPHSLFLFLKTAVDVHLSGVLNISVPETVCVSDIPSGRIRDTHAELEAYMERLSNFPKPLHHNAIYVTDELAELYLEVCSSILIEINLRGLLGDKCMSFLCRSIRLNKHALEYLTLT